MEPRATLLYITMPSLDEGKRIIKTLLEERLIACSNLFPAGVSLYQWEGKIHENPEHVAIAKTLASEASRVVARIQELHPYECPVILTIPLETVPPAILSWLVESVS